MIWENVTKWGQAGITFVEGYFHDDSVLGPGGLPTQGQTAFIIAHRWGSPAGIEVWGAWSAHVCGCGAGRETRAQ